MAIRVNPDLNRELEHFGAADVQKCYHCGNCSATCPFSKEPFVIPRKSMRYLQMGLEERLKSTLEPWLCYYCGECSQQCPRGAEPGETMMSLRRWLISSYDFTGIARLFFRSWKAELVAVMVIALLAGIGFLFYGFSRGDITIYHGTGAFLPSSMIHTVDLALMAFLLTLLAINVFRMWYFTMLKEPKNFRIPWWLYLKKIYLIPWHFFFQRRYAQCGSDRPSLIYWPWLAHLGVVLGYVTMLVIIVLFLGQLQSGPQIDWSVHIFAYASTVGLLFGTIYMLRGRLRKIEVQHQRSHSTDWMFVILLIFIVVTGIIQHVLHRTGFIEAANIAYVVHLMGVIPWLLRMPFSKWAHLVYRPVAMYFAGIISEAMQKRSSLSPAQEQLRPAA